ncbi:L-idonate 5-dehydrogenase [Rhodococcus wratislaviensis]|uniref:Putative zinc-containing alcohol dehydrogenase n=1 Tax=Rhodococcus wratislaviensis NBRC 100605 TaxID=1219028 RepID=X0RGP8_RHOWR|nr:L-idonate 5-dehydrogenase [Rhodococcus wratislaviensis]GAF50245.1 putative zinc-containing alcohol dehydrogenase [Rhodococcus wratislaviensis NBRC 100605]
MRACVVHGAHDLRVEDIEVQAPGRGQIAVDVAYGGVCGSDLHYAHRGGVGDFLVQEPMVLGHEVVGTVAALGDDVDGPEAGTPVAVHPATPCRKCPECLDHRENVCRDTRYLGSAARLPHVQGGFAQRIVLPAHQIRALPEGLSLETAVLAEPLSVALHAVARAGDVTGRSVFVTGAGPIGCLAVAALRAAGACDVIVSDLVPETLAVARAVGATAVVRADDPDAAPTDIDIAVEASGAPAALGACVRAVRRGGRVVQLGLLPPGDVTFPGNLLVTKEIELVGAFRFGAEFDDALALLASGLPVEPVLTHRFPLDQSEQAFTVARDRTQASKVVLDLR